MAKALERAFVTFYDEYKKALEELDFYNDYEEDYKTWNDELESLSQKLNLLKRIKRDVKDTCDTLKNASRNLRDDYEICCEDKNEYDNLTTNGEDL